MSFAAQVRWCRKWGAVMVAVVAALTLLAVVFGGGLLFDVAILITIFAAAVLLVFGGVARPLQKALYHRFAEDQPFYRRFATMPLFRQWLWLTLEGKDRDA